MSGEESSSPSHGNQLRACSESPRSQQNTLAMCQEQIALECSCQSCTLPGSGPQHSVLSMAHHLHYKENASKGCHKLHLYAEHDQYPLSVPQPGEAISVLLQGQLICSDSLLSFIFTLFITSRFTAVILFWGCHSFSEWATQRVLWITKKKKEIGHLYICLPFFFFLSCLTNLPSQKWEHTAPHS